MTDETPLGQRIAHIFLPYYREAVERVKRERVRFAYYTTAATAFQMLQNREVWMRNTQTMNDYMEVRHGVNCVVAAYDATAGLQLKEALDACFPGISVDITGRLNGWIPGFLLDTFVTCFSEHRAEDDEYGRLSMWRAYGDNAGVALVFKTDALFQETNELAAYTSPVAYFRDADVAKQLETIASRVKANHELVRSLGRKKLTDVVFNALRFAAVSIKHPAFQEEKEWRVIASPAVQSSNLVPLEAEVVDGVPQVVLKIRLKNHRQGGLPGLAPAALIDRVLIGPCEHPRVVERALWKLLSEAGVPDAGAKIIVTHIPLRTNQR